MILLPVVALVCGAVAAFAAPIPPETFSDIIFDPLLKDGYQTGEAMLVAGQVADETLADGQFLLQFSPADGGDPVQVSVNLTGISFRHYHIFGHAQVGIYELDLFLGGPGADQLSYVGTFKDFAVDQGSGSIALPADFFPGVVLAAPLSTEFSTRTGVSLTGQILDLSKANGQILFNFVHVDSGDEIPVFIPLDGLNFRRGYLFPQGAAGAYDLEIYLGGADDAGLGFVGRFSVVIIADGTPAAVPIDFFTGVLFDQALAVAWPVRRDLVLRGGVAAGIASLRFDVTTIVREFFLMVPVEDGRFALNVRLDASELGPLNLQVVREMADGLLVGSGSFDFAAVAPPSAPILSLGALSLGLLPDGEQGLSLANLGAAALATLRFEVEDPFSLVSTPQNLSLGGRDEVVIRYDVRGVITVRYWFIAMIHNDLSSGWP